MPADYAASSCLSSGATYVWANDPNDYAHSQRARHTLPCTSGALNCTGTLGVARARTESALTLQQVCR